MTSIGSENFWKLYRDLPPHIREAARETLVIADGFSCREQIAQTTDRQALHTAQVLHMATRDGERGPAGPCPERRHVDPSPRPPSLAASVMLLGAAAVLCALILNQRRSRHV